MRVGYVDLLAGGNPIIAVPEGTGGNARRVRATIGFREGDNGADRSVLQAWQQFSL